MMYVKDWKMECFCKITVMKFNKEDIYKKIVNVDWKIEVLL